MEGKRNRKGVGHQKAVDRKDWLLFVYEVIKSEKKSYSDDHNRQIPHSMWFVDIFVRMKSSQDQSVRECKTKIAEQCSDGVGDQIVDVGCPILGK